MCIKCKNELHFITVVKIIQPWEKCSDHLSIKLGHLLATCLVFGHVSLLVFLFGNHWDFKKQKMFVPIFCKLLDLNNAEIFLFIHFIHIDIYCKFSLNIKFFLVKNYVTDRHLSDTSSMKAVVLHRKSCFKCKNTKLKKISNPKFMIKTLD